CPSALLTRSQNARTFLVEDAWLRGSLKKNALVTDTSPTRFSGAFLTAALAIFYEFHKAYVDKSLGSAFTISTCSPSDTPSTMAENAACTRVSVSSPAVPS